MPTEACTVNSYNLKWEKVVGGKDGFEELIGYAGRSTSGFIHFDFAYA